MSKDALFFHCIRVGIHHVSRDVLFDVDVSMAFILRFLLYINRIYIKS